MGLPDGDLPSTLVEYLGTLDPQLAALSRIDAERLRRDGCQPGFMRLEDTPTAFFDAIRERVDKFVATQARRHGRERALAAFEAHRADFQENFASIARLYHLVLNFELAGAKVYRVAAGLAERLLATRVDVPTDALRLPFPAVMLVFDDDQSLAAFHDLQPFGHPPRGGAISSICIDVPHAEGRRLLAASIHTHGKRAHGMLHRSMRYPAGSLEEMLATSWGDGDSVTQGRAFNRLVLNTLLYIGSKDARIGAEQRGRYRHDSMTYSPRAHVVAGSGLVPLSRTNGYAASIVTRPRGQATRSLAVRQLVGGHWKFHPHGPRRELRKLVWIEPYQRGPDYAELVNRAKLVR